MRSEAAVAPPQPAGARRQRELGLPDRFWPVALGAGMLVYAVTAVTYALRVPIGRSADELSHLNYARIIAGHLALPGAGVLERQQPPLYYLGAAGLLKLGVSEQGVRLVSTLLGLVAVLAVAATVRTVLPERPWLAAGAAASVALLPGFQDLGGSISDDPLAIAVGALLLLVTARVVVTRSPTRGLLIGIGVLAGIALLAKETDWALLIGLGAAIAWRWRGQLRAVHLLPLLGLPVLIAGWWFVRNMATFHRPLPPLTLSDQPHVYLRSAGQLRGIASETLRDLFGPERFQGGLVAVPRAGEALVFLLSAALVLALLMAAVLTARSWRGWTARRRAQVVFLGGAAALALVFSLGNSVFVALQPQARYLLVAAAAPALAVAWSTARLGQGRPRALAATVTIVVIAALTLSAIGIHAAATSPG
ncbi:MAG TPA: glycosyltransferase family 39 protein [Candidatus Dormibacteraeota bacterium]